MMKKGIEMNKPVLFLDFDGPMFPENFIPHGRPISEYPGNLHPFISYWEMSQTSVRQLNALYDIYQFDTVISSSWNHFITLEQCKELFQHNGLNLHLHDEWCTPRRMSSYRVNEICWWLDRRTDAITYEAPAHIILDDPWSGGYLDDWEGFALQQPTIIDPNVGIDPEAYKNMRSTVRCWADDYSTRTYTRVWPNRDYSKLDLG